MSAMMYAFLMPTLLAFSYSVAIQSVTCHVIPQACPGPCTKD